MKSWLNTNTSAAVDRAGAGDHAVARNALLGHAEIGAAMLDEHVDLFERAGIEQQLQALARRQLAAFVLRRDPPGTAARSGGLPLGVELLEDLLHGHPFLRSHARGSP